jgi:hypothetical protein
MLASKELLMPVNRAKQADRPASLDNEARTPHYKAVRAGSTCGHARWKAGARAPMLAWATIRLFPFLTTVRMGLSVGKPLCAGVSSGGHRAHAVEWIMAHALPGTQEGPVRTETSRMNVEPIPAGRLVG